MSTESPSAQSQVQSDPQTKLARRYRHIAYALFGGLTLVLMVFVSYIVLSGYVNDDIYDPFTGESVEAK